MFLPWERWLGEDDKPPAGEPGAPGAPGEPPPVDPLVAELRAAAAKAREDLKAARDRALVPGPGVFGFGAGAGAMPDGGDRKRFIDEMAKRDALLGRVEQVKGTFDLTGQNAALQFGYGPKIKVDEEQLKKQEQIRKEAVKIAQNGADLLNALMMH